MKFKVKNILLVSFLAIAGFFGVSSTLINKQVNEQSVAEKAEAAADVYTIVGTMTGWSTSSNTYKLTDSDGDGVYTVNYNCPSSSNQYFKIIKNHSYDEGQWGYNNLFIKPNDFNDIWNNNNEIGIWHGSAYNMTITFRPSTNNIMIFPQGKAPTSWNKTIYLINNWDDWAYPRAHFWNDDYTTMWDMVPSFDYHSRSYTGDSVTGGLYSYNFPDNIKYLQVKADGGRSTKNNLDVSGSTNNAVHYTYTTQDELTAFKLYVVDNGAYLRGDWADGWSCAGQKAMTGSKGGPYTISTIIPSDCDVNAVYIEDGVETYSTANAYEITSNDNTNFPCTYESGHGNAHVATAGNYSLTVTKDAGGDYWSYAFTCSDLTNAISYASTFNTNIAAKCNAQGATDTSKLKTQWGTEETRYLGLDAYVKGWLASTNPSSNVTIANMFRKYDYVYGKYNSTIGNDFLERNPSSKGVIRDFSPLNLFGNSEDNLSTIIIIAASSVALLSITALSILVIKKRKNKEE